MTRTRRAPRSSEDRAASLEELHARLTEQVQALGSGQDWLDWLRVATRFHDYSFQNVMLIFAQRPDATRVAGYRAWQQLGRQVDKGEHGIKILAPILRRSATDSPDTGDQPTPDHAKVVGYRITHVFDISQTTGAPLPEPPTPPLLAGQAPPGLWDALAGVATSQGYTLRRGDCGGANGTTNATNKIVTVRGDVDEAQAVKTLAHELGHILLHARLSAEERRAYSRARRKVEAESVVFLVCANHGLTSERLHLPLRRQLGLPGDSHPRQAHRPDRPARARRHPHNAHRGPRHHRDHGRRPRPCQPRPDQPHRRRNGPSRGDRRRTKVAIRHGPDSPIAQLAALRAAQAFYAAQVDGSWVPQYLTERGLAAALDPTSPWHIGYAPNDWRALVGHLQQEGFQPVTLTAAGLAIPTRSGNGLIDRFHNRVTLPLHDYEGQIVGFIGRCAPGAEETTAKYLNSPTSDLYRKSEVLLGMHEQADALAHGAIPVLVEGPFDAIAIHLAGDGHYAGLTPCGTALTGQQADQLTRIAADRRLITAFDDDPAGHRASLRALGLLHGIAQVDAAALPSGADPAGVLAASGPGALRECLVCSEPLASRLIKQRLDSVQDLKYIPEKVHAARGLLPLIKALQDDLQPAATAVVAKKLDLTGLTLEDLINDGALPGVIPSAPLAPTLQLGRSKHPIPAVPGRPITP